MRFSPFILILVSIFSCQSRNISDTEVTDEMDTVEQVVVHVKVPRVTTMPDFSQYTDIKEKKKAFFDFLSPMVEEENARILDERARIQSIFTNYDKTKVLVSSDSAWLIPLANQMKMASFDISSATQRNALLRKKDIIPPSLFLAQAANESGWGTSRFAKEANNLFGQWCFTKGCGIIPSKRIAGKYHEIKKFETVNDAVNSYVRNINRHNAYRELRALREQMRNKGMEATGEQLAAGLIRYSARREAYVKEIQSMIRVNRLDIDY